MNYDHGIRAATARDPVQGTTISGTARVTPRPEYRARGGRQSVCFFFFSPAIIIILLLLLLILLL